MEDDGSGHKEACIQLFRWIVGSAGSLFSAATLSTVASAGNVHVVDAAGAGDFTSIQDAVDAASEGDTLLVRSGHYGGFVVGNKGLAIVGNNEANVHVDGGIRIRNLASGKQVVLVHLQSEGVRETRGVVQHGLYLSDNAGSVRVERCVIQGASTPPCPSDGILNGWDAAVVLSSSDVAFVSTSLIGGDGAADGGFGQGQGGRGIYAGDSTLTLYECGVRGGGTSVCCEGSHGGSGMSIVDTLTFASNSSARGIDGGDAAPCPPCANGGNGGYGILSSGPSMAHLLQFTATGGAGGIGQQGLGCGDDGTTGTAYVGSAFDVLPGTARSMVVANPVRDNTVATLTFTGPPGDDVHLMMSLETDSRLKLAWKGMLLLRPRAPHLMTTSLGTIPASGSLDVLFPIADLGPGVESRVVHLQLVFASPNGARQLGSPSSVVVLDQAF